VAAVVKPFLPAQKSIRYPRDWRVAWRGFAGVGKDEEEEERDKGDIATERLKAKEGKRDRTWEPRLNS
jgi:hypothetical protein